jgi:hypothetical protein
MEIINSQYHNPNELDSSISDIIINNLSNSDTTQTSSENYDDLNIDVQIQIKYEYFNLPNPINLPNQNLTNNDFRPSPYKEILRYHNINGLNEYFQMKLKELSHDKYNIYELFKNNSCKLIELINRWCWHQYSNKTCIDNVIPYVKDNNYDYGRFIDDLNYILNIYGTELAIKNNDKIIIELKKLISDYLEVEYFNYSQRTNVDLKIIKEYIDIKIKLSCEYKKNTYQVIIYSKVYTRLKTKLIMFGMKYQILKNYEDNYDELLDQYIFCLVFRYSYMDSGNQQLAINQYIKDMYKKCGVDFELFGSAINTISTNYCSLFYDIEKYFGSNGNFFDIQIKSGIYWCNPPYDDTIMSNAVDKIVGFLESDLNVAFLITIPIWDNHTQTKMKDNNINTIMRNYNSDTESSTHSDFLIYSKLKPYIKDELIIPKHRIPYFNYRKYSSINAVNTYILIVYKNIDPNIAKNLHTNFDNIVDLDSNNFFCKN